ncbi:3-keto-5-aminohexanoate cleavage protein [Pseudidiomarina sp.]|uniref:3-keto-5-aminohexanoate cleavage protein n=1 Tax=Pseudidiomarina sp. TaxID=2081707 RepID=UPI003A972A2C
MSRKVIITSAITGSIYTPTMSPYLPITGEQIAEQSIGAAQAGASIIHLHARVPENGKPSAEVEHFRGFIPQIAANSDAVLNISTGGSSLMSLEERLRPATAMEPEMCSLNMGSMNFGIFTLKRRYSNWKHEWEPELLDATKERIFANTYADIENTICHLGHDLGAKFEFECYDLSHIETLAYFVRKGFLTGPLYVQFVLGVMGGAGATPENLMAMKSSADRLLGDQYRFSVLAAGKHQMELATMGIVLGGHVRVGLEDSLTLPNGEFAKTNAEQVATIRSIIEALGHQVATPDEAREMLKLKGANKVKSL